MENISNELIEEIASNCVQRFNKGNYLGFPTEKNIEKHLIYTSVFSRNDHKSIEDVCGIFENPLSFMRTNKDLETPMEFTVISEDKAKEVASKIYQILDEDKKEFLSKNGKDYYDYELDEIDEKNREKEQIGLISNLLKEEFENGISVEINQQKLDKAKDFKNSISIIEDNIKLLDFNDFDSDDYSEYVRTRMNFSINFIKKDNKEHYSIAISSSNKEIEISSDNLSDFKEKLIEEIKDNVLSKIDFYLEEKYEEEYEMRKENLRNLRNIDLKSLEIETENDIHFRYSKSNVFRDLNDSINNVFLFLEKDNVLIEKNEFDNLDFANEITYAIKNNDFSDLLGRTFLPSYHTKEYDKLEKVKEDTEYYIKKMDNLVKIESLGMARKEIYTNTIDTLYSEERELTFKNFPEIAKEHFNRSFNDRIDCVKDKETLVMNNLEELKISKNDISNDEIEKKEFFDDILQNYKETSINNFLNEVEKHKEIEISKGYEYDTLRTREETILLESMRIFNATIDRDFGGFFNLQKYTLNNLMAITIDEEKINVLPLQINLNEVPKEIENKLYDSVISNFKNISDTLNGDFDKNNFKSVIRGFRFNKFKELVDLEIEIPKKAKDIEKDIENKKEKGLEIE